MNFSDQDLQQLRKHGIEPARADRQLARLRAGQVAVKLERPCTAGDGIVQLAPGSHSQLEKAFATALAGKRLQRFVPASGAATRMFAKLRQVLEPGPGVAPADGELQRLLDNLPSFAFYPDLAQTMAEEGHDLGLAAAEGDPALIVRYLLEPCGLGYSLLPKGLLAFHAAADGARTPFIEHLAEAALFNGPEGTGVLHFTVSPEHLELFRAQFCAWRGTLEETYGCRFEVSYSTQKPSTDTLALDADGQALRDGSDRLVLRPGGHGALIENLDELAGDIVLVRNIDNVVPDARKAANLTWTRLLTGYLLDLQQEQHLLLNALHGQPDDPQVRELAICFLADRMQADVDLQADGHTLIGLLDRPLRVCGMVPNSGEPGGGPFWVRDAKGRISRQIVEEAQIDKGDPGQAAILAESTHFNPVDMVCAIKDWRGRSYDLTRFVDDDAVIITSKMQDGKQVRVLELPGLWNGGMALWHTLFVEIPPATFNPVKTVFDLLRPAHQP